MAVWICERKGYQQEQGKPYWTCVARVTADTKKEAAKKAFGHNYCCGMERIRKEK